VTSRSAEGGAVHEAQWPGSNSRPQWLWRNLIYSSVPSHQLEMDRVFRMPAPTATGAYRKGLPTLVIAEAAF